MAARAYIRRWSSIFVLVPWALLIFSESGCNFLGSEYSIQSTAAVGLTSTTGGGPATTLVLSGGTTFTVGTCTSAFTIKGVDQTGAPAQNFAGGRPFRFRKLPEVSFIRIVLAPRAWLVGRFR